MKCKKCNKCKIELLHLPVCEVQEVHPYGGAPALAPLCTPYLLLVQE